MINSEEGIETVRASRAGHTFHERWAARRALQLVFPNDALFAIAVEGISSTETTNLGASVEEVADLVLYYGLGDNFQTCERLETIQFKYKLHEEAVTASYLKKTIEKFSDTILGYENGFSASVVDKKASFLFVTNAEFKESLWEAITSLITGAAPSNSRAENQAHYLRKLCADRGLLDAGRLFSRIVFQAGEKDLAGQENELIRTLTSWSAGADPEAKRRLQGLQDLILKKAGPNGQGKNLIRREDVLDALDCDPEDLFPAKTCFIDVGAIVKRAELESVHVLLKESELPIFVHAEGGVGKTVFVHSLASMMECEFEVVVFDCFGGGSYRSDHHSRHLPKIGLVQIVNELASRTLCDPMLPGSDDYQKIIKAACKRFAQAAKAITTQSKKLGLLIIIDAADNAQLEADYRHENAFPKLLLSAMGEEPINDVRLLFTARTHRKDTVIGRTAVKEVELSPFSKSDALQFLKARKSNALSIEVVTALKRSGRNARVLDYLVQTWDENICDKSLCPSITVIEIIDQRCKKIMDDLFLAGWSESEIAEFFVALSLLPPPIPLEELAKALGWSAAHVNAAASDLAPMLEITSHGAIFRDEPTESYIRDKYSKQPELQRVIADHLLASQATSTYAAEALPHFLVVIKDSDRAFALVDSLNFPTSIQSEFGRRKLMLVRLRAAFRLAVSEDDFDRVLSLSMRLAQVATANMRGDEFIRCSPSLAVILGDIDSYRRLFADRSGWRGARSARLTVAHCFAGDFEEAKIQAETTVRWINWHIGQSHDELDHDQDGPSVHDYVTVLFQHVVEGEFAIADSNLARWNNRFSMAASEKLLKLLEQFDQARGAKVLTDFVTFSAGDECTSQALKLRLLSHPQYVDGRQVKALAKAIGKYSSALGDDSSFQIESEREYVGDIERAALTTVLLGSKAAAAEIIRHAVILRPSFHDYSERYRNLKVWPLIFRVCVRAWSAGRAVAYHDLVPNEVKINRRTKVISSKAELVTFLKALREPAPVGIPKKSGQKHDRTKFGDREIVDISNGIEIALELIRPIEDAILSGNGIAIANISDFLDVWNKHLRNCVDGRVESAVDLIVRAVGFGCVDILLNYASTISADQAKVVVNHISSERFSIEQKLKFLRQLVKRELLYELAGQFAQHIADQIQQDDNIEQRGESYLELATSLVPMSINEAREYYRQGLAQLDQMGGESYEQIYSLLHYASAQQGGLMKPALAQRLMNLCQTIVRNEPRKFGWTLFARAAANSIGLPAIAKLVRWHDQDVADFSYGLPQLACFLAKNGNLDPRRAALFVSICEDHGWWDWRSGDGIADLLKLSEPADRRRIFLVIIEKLRAEHSFGAWPSLWESFLEAGNQFPNVITAEEREEIEGLRADARSRQEESNSYNNSPHEFLAVQSSKLSEAGIDGVIEILIAGCDPSLPASIDGALQAIAADERLSYATRQRFITGLCAACPYPEHLAFLTAVCDTSEMSFIQSLEILVKCFVNWRNSSAYLMSSAKTLVQRLFECKGAQMFDGQYSDLTRSISQLSEFCCDKRFVLSLVLRKIAANEVELDGDEWLQLSTALCDVTSGQVGLNELELLLAGPTSRIADVIGEGAFRPEQKIEMNEDRFFADVIWHLLGDDDAYIRWKVARGLSAFADLRLSDDLALLLDRFDLRAITALASPNRKLSFQNSQQWLLMGLARATLRHGQAMQLLSPKLVALAKRNDVHVINKIHIARCLRSICGEVCDEELKALLRQINHPSCGIIVSDVYPVATTLTSDFRFGYEFSKYEIDAFARLFNIERAVAENAIVTEITSRWPEATSLDFFRGPSWHQGERIDRYESYAEHIQRHALIHAVTNLSQTHPVVARSYGTEGESPWLEWCNRYDITFDDGSWLSDWKDDVPPQAKENLLGARADRQETLLDQESVLRKLGLGGVIAKVPFPLYGRWSSPDGVTVSITSALTERKGAIGRCATFAKLPSHDFWLPEFWDGGYYDQHYRQKSPFYPLVWAPEMRSLGIDVGDEIASEGPAGRPRLGVDLTEKLRLTNNLNSADWYSAEGILALRSQVWGSWKPDPDHRHSRHHDDGELLWASPDWLATTLSNHDWQLVFILKLWKHRSSYRHDPLEGVKSVYFGLWADDGKCRLWHAKKASKLGY